MYTKRDVIKLAECITNSVTRYFGKSNGDSEYRCPFCNEKIVVSGNRYQNMEDIAHNIECVYLIAKDILMEREVE